MNLFFHGCKFFSVNKYILFHLLMRLLFSSVQQCFRQTLRSNNRRAAVHSYTFCLEFFHHLGSYKPYLCSVVAWNSYLKFTNVLQLTINTFFYLIQRLTVIWNAKFHLISFWDEILVEIFILWYHLPYWASRNAGKI